MDCRCPIWLEARFGYICPSCFYAKNTCKSLSLVRFTTHLKLWNLGPVGRRRVSPPSFFSWIPQWSIAFGGIFSFLLIFKHKSQEDFHSPDLLNWRPVHFLKTIESMEKKKIYDACGGAAIMCVCDFLIFWVLMKKVGPQHLKRTIKCRQTGEDMVTGPNVPWKCMWCIISNKWVSPSRPQGSFSTTPFIHSASGYSIPAPREWQMPLK